MTLSRILKSIWPWRWWNCLHALAGGVRVHPSVCLLGSTTRIRLGHGSSIGARSRLDAGSLGQIVLGERVWISSDVEIETNSEVHIGEGTSIQRRCTINGSTRIGAGCIFAPNVFVSSGTHPFRNEPHLPIREQEKMLMASTEGVEPLDRPVWIQDDCWLGANVVVCPGVTIGKGSVVGANAVVTHDVAPYSVVAGAPAKSIGRRLEWLPRNSICANDATDQPYILSGKLRKDADDASTYLELSFDTPVCFALSASRPAVEIVLHWDAPSPVQFEVGDRSYSVSSGSGKLGLPIDIIKKIDEVFYCAIKISDLRPHTVLQISLIEIQTSE
jgi:acetyltransferase-like isoleucine patch superfamily enzyme